MKVRATLVKGAQVFAPEPLGTQDILMVSDRVVEIGPGLSAPAWADVHEIDARGRLVFPGLVDQHVHIVGGGGEGGPQFRTPELHLTDLTRYGLTTVVGVLGTDGTTRSTQELLAKARALTIEGINAWLYTGAYQMPTRTITGDPRNDIMLIDRILGVGEIAISDHRGSHPSDRELAHLAGEARTGGLLAGKAGVVHLHVGSGARRLDPIYEVLGMADVPIGVMVPTHLNRTRDLLEDAVRLGGMGGFLDITSSISPDEHDRAPVGPAEAVAYLRQEGVPLDHISFSTDAGGSAPVFDSEGHLLHMGVGMPDSLFKQMVRLHDEAGYDWSEAILPGTRTPATILKMEDVGVIRAGARADIIVTDGRDIHTVVAGGRVMVDERKPLVYGTFEKPGDGCR